MKKLLLAACALSLTLVAQGQYFTKEYGSATVGDRLTDGTAGLIAPVGHIVTGTTNSFQFTDMVLIRTDIAGDVAAAPFFRRAYRLQNAAGGQLTSTPAKVIQMPGGNIFVVGTYQNAVTTFIDRGIYTAVFDAMGNPISIRGWKATAASVTAITATSACRAVGAGTTVFITGNMDLTPYGAAFGNGIFALAVDGNTNVFGWSAAYNLPLITNETAADIIASPYAAEVLMIGNFAVGNDGKTFVLRANSATGVSIAATVFDYAGTIESVSAIALSTSTVAASTGFVICGTTNNGSAVNRMWVFKINTIATVVLGNVFVGYSNVNALAGSDIIQRQTPAGAFQFFASGTATNGIIGSADMVVIKLSFALGFLGEYTYGKPATREFNAEIAAHADGFGVYGNTSSGVFTNNEEMYVAKAYYNGVTQCNVATGISALIAPALLPAGTTHAVVGALAPVVLTIANLGQVIVYPICNAAAVAGGSNARLAQQDETSEVTTALFPNPVSLSNPLLNLNLNSASDQQIEVRVTDLMGREVLNQRIIVTSGTSIQQLSLPSGITAGIYMLSLSGEGIAETHRFVVE